MSAVGQDLRRAEAAGKLPDPLGRWWGKQQKEVMLLKLLPSPAPSPGSPDREQVRAQARPHILELGPKLCEQGICGSKAWTQAEVLLLPGGPQW